MVHDESPFVGIARYLKPLLMPDPGECWVHGDYSAIELRIIAALANDELLLEGFANGYDLHCFHTAQSFGWDSFNGRLAFARSRNRIRPGDDVGTDVAGTVCPHYAWQACLEELDRNAGRGWSWNLWKQVDKNPPVDWKIRTPDDTCERCWISWVHLGGPPPDWEGDDDLRRRFVKGMVFKFLYGGIPETAHKIPGVNKLGLSVDELVGAGQRWMAAHAGLEVFWDQVKTQVEQSRLVRTPFGRPRRLLHFDLEKAKRAGLNHPAQGGAADFLNSTIIGVLNRAPWAGLAYTVHDYAAFRCAEKHVEELTRIVKEEAEKPRRIGNYDLVIPFAMDKPKEYKEQRRAA